jgi:hypothetical protein
MENRKSVYNILENLKERGHLGDLEERLETA